MLYKPNELAAKLGVSSESLRVWSDGGGLTCIRTNGGHRRYEYNDATVAEATEKRKIIYARVSSAKQREDLGRQVAFLTDKYPTHEVIQDVGSGLNFKRKGLLRILDAVLLGAVSEVVVAHRDRIARFGVDMLEHVFQKRGTLLTVVHSADYKPSGPAELADDLLSIITVFTARFYGSRKYRREVGENADGHQENPRLPKCRAVKDVQEVLRGHSLLLQSSEPVREGTDAADQGRQTEPLISSG